MKKLYTLTLALAASLTVAAAPDVKELTISTEPLPAELQEALAEIFSGKMAAQAQPKSFKSQIIEAGNLQVAPVKEMAKAQKAVAKSAVTVTSDSWTDLGDCPFQDPFLTWAGGGTPTYNVPVRQNSVQTGIYQLVDPFSHNTSYSAYVTSCGQNWNFDATDPTKVIGDVLQNAFTLGGSLASYGTASLYPIAGYYIESGYASELEDSDYGVLENKKIKFASGTIAINFSKFNPTKLYSLSDDMVISLPGAKNYDISVTAENNCNATNQFSVSCILGSDAAGGKLLVYPGLIEPDDEVYAYVSTSTYSTAFEQSTAYTINLSKDTEHGYYTILAVSLDAEGNWQEGARTVLFAQPDESANWKSIGKGKYTDGIIPDLYSNIDSQTATVDIEENIAKPGYFRVVNPYSSMTAGTTTNNQHSISGHNHYIYVNATNPDQVYIEASPLGIDLGYGDVVIYSYVAYFLDYGYTAEQIAASLPTYFGTFADNAITFNTAGTLLAGEVYYKDLTWYGVNGDTNFKIELPADYNGVNDVIVDNTSNSAVEYFNLQGVRVNTPAKGQLVIKRQGDKVSKIIAQ
jgi:hypothetical protein